jgi:hypothetical protein
MGQEEELKIWGMTKPLTRNIITGIIVILVGGNGFFAAKWVASESNLNQCYREATIMERENGKEKQAAAEALSVLNYKLGILTAKVEYLENMRKK